MNIRTLIFTSAVLTNSVVLAGRPCQTTCRPQTSCCPQPGCSAGTQTCGSSESTSYSYASGPTTKWFKAKDGSIREVMSHWDALHRSVEADQMEIDLAGVRTELQTVTAERDAAATQLAELTEKAAADVAALQNQLAKLKQQLGEQTKLATSEKSRADKAESAHKEAQQTLTKLQQDMQQTVAERDALKQANDKLQQTVAAAQEAKAEADVQRQAVNAELEKMKQEAMEARKAAVVKQDDEEEVPAEPAQNEAPKPEPPVADVKRSAEGPKSESQQ